MGSQPCTSCFGMGYRTVTESRPNPLPGPGPVMVPVQVQIRCAHCAGAGYITTYDPPPKIPAAPKPRPITRKPVAGASSPIFSSGTGGQVRRPVKPWTKLNKLFALIGFFIGMGGVYNLEPEAHPLIAISIGVVMAGIVGSYWQVLVVIGILAVVFFG